MIDHYWQTETGWPLLSAHPGRGEAKLKMGSPSFPVYGYDVHCCTKARAKRSPTAKKAS